MTRINANIPPAELIDSHLLAEHREIVRICSTYKKRLDSGKPIAGPANFSLGTGHVLFFIDKGQFTFHRYQSLYTECISRGFNVTDYSKAWDVYLMQHWSHHSFKMDDNDTVRQRIMKRIVESKQQPKYKGQSISKLQAVELLKFENEKFEISSNIYIRQNLKQ